MNMQILKYLIHPTLLLNHPKKRNKQLNIRYLYSILLKSKFGSLNVILFKPHFKS